MEAAVSTENKNKNELFCKSKIIQNPRKWNRSSASGECGAQVGNRSEKAACSMAEEQGATNQDAGCPPHAGARRSLLSRTQLHRLSTIFTPVLSPCCPATGEAGVPDRRTRREQAHTAVGTGAWQCLRLPKPTAPLSAPVLPPKSCTSSRRGSLRPSPRLISHLRGRKRPHRLEAPQL